MSDGISAVGTAGSQLVGKKLVGGTSETAVSCNTETKSTSDTSATKNLSEAENDQLTSGLTGTDKKDSTKEVENKKDVDVNKLSDEELEKLAEKIAAKIKQENDVEGLSKTGQAQKGTCCGGTTKEQAADKTNDANNKLQEAYNNYVTAKQNKADADANVKTAEDEVAAAKSQKITNADGSQTQDQNAISQAEAKLKEAKAKQEEAKAKLKEAEKALIQAQQEANNAQTNQSNIENSISKAETNYQNTYREMLGSCPLGNSLSYAA